MNFIRQIYDRFFPNVQPLPAGMYSYQSDASSSLPYRLHLRLEPDGNGMLIINAHTVLHLNQTAAEFAYYLIQQTPPEEVAQKTAKRYNIPAQQALQDYNDLKVRLETLIHTPDLDPNTFLDFERQTPHENLSAPYRLDCALTYQVSEPENPNAVPEDRVKRELSTEEWQSILLKAWKAGIVHIIFTGGEPTLRPDLPDLITTCEKTGQVTGLITDGLRLTNPHFVHKLLNAGLDHVMLVLDPSDEQSWEALRDLLPEDIFVTVHLTITHHNQADIPALIERLAEKGVKSLSLSAEDDTLKQALAAARDQANQRQITLTWDMPAAYSNLNPVSMELAEAQEQVEGAGKAWLYVEPDGDVLPGQGNLKVLGNLLNQSWEEVWQNR
jgi:organic radical activating enzyme